MPALGSVASLPMARRIEDGTRCREADIGAGVATGSRMGMGHMIVFPRGEVKTWSDLTPGALFGVSIGGETHLAVKIQAADDEFNCGVLSGLPPHSVRATEVQSALLYFFPNSKIVPVGRRLQFSADSPRP